MIKKVKKSSKKSYAFPKVKLTLFFQKNNYSNINKFIKLLLINVKVKEKKITIFFKKNY